MPGLSEEGVREDGRNGAEEEADGEAEEEGLVVGPLHLGRLPGRHHVRGISIRANERTADGVKAAAEGTPVTATAASTRH